jgi:glycosyltransferase involved in cell wall biosynthesis
VEPEISLNPAAGSSKVAYIVSRFPTIAETFILYEILALEQAGLTVEVFSLLRQREKVVHPGAEALVKRAHYGRFVSSATLTAQLYWLSRNPLAYISGWWRAILGNLFSPKFLIRALAVVPQAALFARQMQALGVRHVHAHWATHPTLAAYIVHRLTGLPYSFTAHADDIYVERPMLAEKIQRASFVVAISEYNRQFLGALYGASAEKKIVVIHCGVDSSVFQARPAKQRAMPFTIVCVARLEEKKGHSFLIQACAKLKASGIPFQCLLIGEGSHRPRLEQQIAKLGLAKQVFLLGQQPRDRVSALMSQAHAMVLPSVTTANGRKEGIPVALMEALASELPAIATSISGIPELVENDRTGILVPERDAEALAEALIRLYYEPKLGEQLGAEGRRKVLREFDLNSNAAKLLTLFKHSRTSQSTAPPLPGSPAKV